MAAAIAYIPAGFGFNMMLSSYARDKGWGMGSKVGYISAVIGGKKVKLLAEEVPFKLDEENLKRWKGWLTTVRIDAWIVMSFITFITVLMTSVLAYGLLAPKGLTLFGFKVASAQAEALALQAYQEGRADGLSEGLEKVGDLVERLISLEHRMREIEKRLDAIEELKMLREDLKELKSRVGSLEAYILSRARPAEVQPAYR